MRDKIKNIEYYNKLEIDIQESIDRKFNWIDIGKTPKDRINIMKQAIVWDYISLIASKYSKGAPITNLKNDLLKAIQITNESWDGFWKLEYEGRKLNQYILSAYDEMLWMLSLGYLLDISNEDFKKLVDVIDRDGIKDYLFEFIIRAKLPERKFITEESYEYGWKLFGKLRQAIIETDKQKAEKLVKDFLEKDWYKEHKDAGWYDSHKSKHDIYYGYWSFETAAVVKIMGLDDSSFRENQYYPKDLVRNNIT